jgi:pyruvate/2-oxoglutarate dehydrogenase complex dihydrolipoamide dehydrogenase (E3) component
VVIVERAKLGGDCTWTGCVPSKSLIASAKAAQATRKQMQQNPPISFKEVRQRFENNVNHIFEEDDSAEALAKFNVDTITGAAKLTSSKVVKVDDSFDIQAKEGIILCTGAVPKFPGIPGLDTVKYITYEDVWELEELPKKLTVVGGGPVSPF